MIKQINKILKDNSYETTDDYNEEVCVIDVTSKSQRIDLAEKIVKNLALYSASFELPSDDIFDMPEVNLKNPLDEFYYYERPAYLEDDQKQFRERLQKALNYLKGN